MQKMMSERKINPAAGCLPVLIQMPILFGFYHAISRMNVTDMILVNSFGLNLQHQVLHLQFLQDYAVHRSTYRSSNGQPTNENNDVYHAVHDYDFRFILAGSTFTLLGNR